MPTEKAKSKGKVKPPDQTAEEPAYLRCLIDEETPVAVRLRDNQEFHGTVEFYDASFIRLTRADGPNLFIFKHDIKYVAELER